MNEAMRDWVTNVDNTHYDRIGLTNAPKIVASSSGSSPPDRHDVGRYGRLPVRFAPGGASNAIGMFAVSPTIPRSGRTASKRR